MDDFLKKRIEQAVEKAWYYNKHLKRVQLIIVAIDEYKKRAMDLKNIRIVNIQKECISLVDSMIRRGKIKPSG